MSTRTAPTPLAAPALVETKLAPARRRPGDVVVRPRLQRQLDRLSPVALTLVDAPVGFGKTLLVESWVAEHDGALAWVSLEPGDSDVSRLWTYVATAIDRVRPGLGRSALSLLRSPGSAGESVVDELLNGINAFRAPVTIVLDDAHAISDAACWETIERLVRHLPPGARVIMTARSDPPLPLGLLRARGALGEIRAPELAFTFDEARELLVGREGIALGDADLELLLERTEGWPAGLYLAALWLRELDDPAAGVQAFHGDHRHVVDYLTGEVLDTLDEDTHRFLLETSALGVFDAPLCDRALGRVDSAERLVTLERQNSFLIGLDATRTWYRYHHLFGELLELELANVDPQAPARLHEAASRYFWEQGRLVEALEHAAAAGDAGLVAAILVEEHRTLLRSGRVETLLRWCDWLGEKRLVAWPQVALAAALAAGLDGRPAHVRRRFVAVAERSRKERPAEWDDYREAGLALVRCTWIDDDVAAAVADAQDALELVLGVTDVAGPFLGSLAVLLFLAGDDDGARARATEMLDRPEAGDRPHGLVRSLATLSLVETASGSPEAAEAHAVEAIEAAKAAAIDGSASGGLARVARAAAVAAQGRLREAEAEAEKGERLHRCANPELNHLHGLLVLAGIKARRGRIGPAAAALRQVRAGLATFADAGRLPALADAVERMLDEARAGAATPIVEPPSEAELAVLRLLATELSQREIGGRLFVSLNTVKTHTRALYRKLGVASREEAVARATTLGLLETGDSPG